MVRELTEEEMQRARKEVARLVGERLEIALPLIDQRVRSIGNYNDKGRGDNKFYGGEYYSRLGHK